MQLPGRTAIILIALTFAGLAQSTRVVSSSQPKFRLTEADLIAEDIAYDAKFERFFVSSVRYGKILSVDREGTQNEFVKPGLPNTWGFFALRADARRRVLWATTAAVPQYLNYRAADEGKSALLEFNLDSGKLLRRFDPPEPGKHLLGDMTLASDGTLYISDGPGAVYRLAAKAKSLERLIAPGALRNPQTPALAESSHRLFIPDYPRGIAIVDLVNPAAPPSLLPHPADLVLGGIDGMYLYNRTLIACQNGTRPNRLVSIQLDSTLSKVESWRPLEMNTPELGDPTHGVVVSGRFYFIAHAGWDNFGDDGKPVSGAALTAPEIRMIDLVD